MEIAKEIFLDTARKGKITHIGVHLDLSLITQYLFVESILRAFSQAGKVSEATSPHFPSLWTTLNSPVAVTPIGPNDLMEMSDKLSAINNTTHTRFLSESEIQTALISGFTASKCVNDTRLDCIARKITPIMVMDATDIGQPPFFNPVLGS